jgi:hypothetical protein
MITKNLSNLCPSSVHCLGTAHSFTFSTFPVVPVRCFANGMTTQTWLSGFWESHLCVCVCVGSPQCLHETFFDLNLFHPFWEMFCKQHDNTVIHASHMGNYMLHAWGSETLQTFTFQLLKGKQRTSVTFQTDSNIPILLHVFPFLLYNKTLYSFTMLPSSSCTCVLLRKYWTLSYVTYFTLTHFYNLFCPPPPFFIT